jgi:hypothetical protein
MPATVPFVRKKRRTDVGGKQKSLPQASLKRNA